MIRQAQSLPNLNLWFKITLKPGTDIDDFIEKLKRLDSVEIVEPAPLPAPPPAITPDFTGNQGYLNAATGGIEARYAWTIPGGNGSGVKIYDVEYSWNQTHEDLSKANGIALLLSPGESSSDPFNNNNHGTAVLGEIIADNDTKGVTGISWGANIGLAPANTTPGGYKPENAIVLAVANGSPGDVILVEQQYWVCGLGGTSFGPVEWLSPVFNAIQTATANGFVVVEAAGNGAVNLDQASCLNKFNRAVQDSGAIIVGAGRPPSSGFDRQRESFSSYGSRVDVQGWGSDVMATGYGDFYNDPGNPTDPNFWYTKFSGTSSASPIVAGAVANLQGIAKQLGTLLTPSQIRTLLVQTGSPQLGNTAEHIGPRPDLQQALVQLYPPDLSLTKAVSPTDPVLPGQTITYTLTFSNTRTDTTNVVITDIVPITLTGVSVVSSGVTITNTGVNPGFVWDVQDLAWGEGGVITITGQINPALAATVFTNTAEITGTGDTTPGNNSSAVGVTVVMPDLTVGKVNDVGGTVSLGTNFNWTVTVANTGGAPATFSTGQTILTDALPGSGATYGTPSVQNATNVTNAANIQCSIAGNDLTCIANGAAVTLGATNGSFQVTMPVTPTTTGTLTNPRLGGFCRVDPNNKVTESNESNNDGTDTVTINNNIYLPLIFKN